jgi:uncharacterized Ntn-hydrolase superfamily protein
VTFSIVAYDPSNGDLGIAVASRFLAVGAVVPWARAGVGAVATQASANTRWGTRGLDLLKEGRDPRQVIQRLSDEDFPAYQSKRQVGIVDARGRAASFSGRECTEWAGGKAGPCFACLGNILAGPEVVDALASGFQTATGELAERLLAALAYGQAAGGDRRGQQSAALLVVRADAGYAGGNDRYIDIRVDDHPQPIDELRRLLDLWRIAFANAP